MAKSQKVTFTATKMVKKNVDVEFRKRSGEEVSFDATKRVPKQVEVSFTAKKK